ncbi:MAG TPA: zf-HC2 domain-containing protein [Thermoanaerobaculia bacterium]|jgi:hypothetical protein|nr:zf-HC2 domain-containing protein [Thermoanaerobaculia bacterium]
MNHPEPETLAAYHAGELTGEEEARLQDHLVACRECAALLLDLDGLADPGFGAGSLSPADQEALWGRIQGEMKKEEAPVAPVIPLRRPAAPSRSPRWLQVAAAALLVITLGQWVWVASLRRAVHDLSRPQANTPVLDLDADAVRSPESEEPYVVRPEDRFFTLILTPSPERRYERYRVEIARADGRVAWSDDEALSPDHPLSITVPRIALGSGSFQVRFFGLAPGIAGGKELIKEHALRVEGR